MAHNGGSVALRTEDTYELEAYDKSREAGLNEVHEEVLLYVDKTEMVSIKWMLDPAKQFHLRDRIAASASLGTVLSKARSSNTRIS